MGHFLSNSRAKNPGSATALNSPTLSSAHPPPLSSTHLRLPCPYVWDEIFACGDQAKRRELSNGRNIIILIAFRSLEYRNADRNTGQGTQVYQTRNIWCGWCRQVDKECGWCRKAGQERLRAGNTSHLSTFHVYRNMKKSGEMKHEMTLYGHKGKVCLE